MLNSRLPAKRKLSSRPVAAFLAWQHGLNYPIYVPNELQGVAEPLSNGRVFEACNELWRLATLGADPAAALLGYMSLRGIKWTGAQFTEILERCREAATRGNSYAQYVMALHERERKDFLKEWYWLNLANKQLFGPALAESGRMAACVVGQANLAKSYFRRGIRSGHLPSMVYFLSLCIRGKYGLAWRIVGIMAFPVTAILLSVGARCFPFKLFVFSHIFASTGSLYDERR
jgi:hypothetical protein